MAKSNYTHPSLLLKYCNCPAAYRIQCTDMPINRPILIRGGIAVGVIVVVMGAFFVARTTFGPDTPAPRQTPGSQVLRKLTDTQAGFSIQYPRKWQRFEHQDPQVALVAGPGGEEYVLVRVCSLVEAIPADAVPQLKDGFDAIIKKTNPTIRQEKRVSLNGLAGFHYLYTFVDDRSKQEGVHSHYFLVDQSILLQLVLQALPTGDFEGVAQTFDKVANSFSNAKRTGKPPPCSAAPPPAPGQAPSTPDPAPPPG